ncbi:mitochondrial pyruvate carrier 2-like [Scaptodrosophila lebanonensis]|uniref:Mitochondrial pyruvate carrier n=1 Tax=Drosophila lebanonensis TaxID=7225 RepID=A0A6J2U500_DROLE|nr:mitochondrial pyruvate carrier 2-like [Scaptodrosophila lebanonensis]
MGPFDYLLNQVDQALPAALRPLWHSPVGPRTIFFWAPTIKWAVVLAGIADMYHRPPESVAREQCAMLAITGLLWSRWAVQIKPRNYNYLAVNLTLFLSQAIQLYRSTLVKDNSVQTTEVNYERPWLLYWI